MREERRAGIPIVQLFRCGRAAGTTLLWIVSFMNVLGEREAEVPSRGAATGQNRT